MGEITAYEYAIGMVGVGDRRTARSTVVGGNRTRCQSRETGFRVGRGWPPCDSQGRQRALHRGWWLEEERTEESTGTLFELLCCRREVRRSSTENEGVGEGVGGWKGEENVGDRHLGR